MELTLDQVYEEDFRSQPLYQNKFNLSEQERAEYLESAPEWVRKWQEELDKF